MAAGVPGQHGRQGSWKEWPPGIKSPWEQGTATTDKPIYRCLPGDHGSQVPWLPVAWETVRQGREFTRNLEPLGARVSRSPIDQGIKVVMGPWPPGSHLP